MSKQFFYILLHRPERKTIQCIYLCFNENIHRRKAVSTTIDFTLFRFFLVLFYSANSQVYEIFKGVIKPTKLNVSHIQDRST